MFWRIIVVWLVLSAAVFAPARAGGKEDWEALNAKVGELHKQGKYQDAIPLAERAVELAERVFGPDHPDTATSLSNLAGLYRAQGRFADAEPHFKRALAIYEKALGPSHPDTATGFNNLAELYQAQGRYAEAEPLYKRALAIYEKALGPSHPDTATGLSNLATLYYTQGRYAEAEPLYIRGLAIREKALGPDHPDIASSLNNLATLYYTQGRYAEAEPLYARGLAIREKAFGPDHPDTALSVHSLAMLYRAKGRYAEAELLYKRALFIWERVLGPYHPNTATSLHSLAELYQAEGRYSEAELLLKRALAIREKALGRDHPDNAKSIINLAGLYRDQGRYAEAEPLYKRALAICEKALGPNHPDTALGLNNLAGLYYTQGRYAEAEPLYKRALAIREEALGFNHPDSAISLANLATLHRAQGRYSEAELLYKRALAIHEEALGRNHPHTATSLSNLSTLYSTLGRYAEAELLLKRALAIREKALGVNHSDVANSLNSLATLYYSQGRYAESEPLYKRALAIYEKALGPSHPDTNTILNNLAGLYRARTNWSDAALLFRRSCRILSSRAKAVSGQAQNVAEKRQSESDLGWCAVSLTDSLIRWKLSGSAGTKPASLALEAFEAAQDAALSSTAVAFARGAAQLDAKLKGAGEAAKTYESLTEQLSALDLRFSEAAGRGGIEAAAALQNLNAERTRLTAAREQAGQALRANAREYFDLIVPSATSVSDLQANVLRDGEAVIVLVPRYTDPKERALKRLSLIFVATKQRFAWSVLPETVSAAGNTLAISEAIATLRQSALTELDTPRDAEVTLRDTALNPFDRSLAFAIYQALFEGSPDVKAALADPQIKTWILAPQGEFLSLPFNALVTQAPTGADGDAGALRTTAWLGWERTLQIVPSVSSLKLKRLGQPQGVAATQGAQFLGFGDPDFARTGESRASCPKPSPGDRSRSPGPAQTFFRGVNANLAALRGLKRLPGTCREVTALGKALNAPAANIVLGLSASEPGVRKHPGLSTAKVITFATHGLVAGDLGLAQPALALTPPANDNEVKDTDDGLLTTVDVASLDLSADWVLLSACNTAAKGGNAPDGLSGLARAFFFAGARALLVSHWPVDDNAGAQLTTETIKAMARDPKLSRAEAFRLAMKTVATQGDDPRLAHPGFWAPYFLVTPE